MSILVGPFGRRGRSEEASRDEDEDLLVFGYACKLYRDEAKALLEDSGQLLIPWMGDHSLMVDRYDVRNRLEDKNQFGLKSNLPHRPTAEEVELEEELDYERYLALERDDLRVAEQEEEEKKRQNESAFSAVGFSYNNTAASSTPQEEEEEEDPPMLACYPQRLDHPPTSSVDQGEDEEGYTPPVGLIIPGHIKTPTTNKLHSIIEKTALFIVKQGAQMEIIIKAKQRFNPFFSFLDHNDALFPYYQHVKEMLTRGAYVPKQSSPAPPSLLAQNENGSTISNGVDEKEDTRVDEAEAASSDSPGRGDPETKESGSDGEDSDSDDDGGYLHPLLMGGGLKNSSKSSTPNPPDTREASPSSVRTTDMATVTTPTSSVAYTTSSIAFYSKRLSINSAPTIDTRTSVLATSGPPRLASSTSGETSATNGSTAHHQIQYSYDSSGHQYHAPSSSSSTSVVEPAGPYAGQYDQHGYSYQNHAPGPEHHTGSQHPNVYSSSQPHHYTLDGGYYESTGVASSMDQAAAHYDYQAYYYNSAEAAGTMTQYDGSAYSAPPPAPPPDILPVVTKTAEYVAKNGDAFERTVIERHAGDPRFGFLNPWDKSHAYYQMLKQQHRHRIAYDAYAAQMGWNLDPGMGMGQGVQPSEMSKENVTSEPINLQRLSESGTISFKLQPPKPTKVFDPSSLVDLGTSEEVGDETTSNEGSANCNGYEEGGGEPPSKKPRLESTKMGTKVEEFLSTVKAMLGTE